MLDVEPGPVELQVELACNGMFGAARPPVGARPLRARARFDPEAWRLAFDFEMLRALEVEPGTTLRWAGRLREELYALLRRARRRRSSRALYERAERVVRARARRDRARAHRHGVALAARRDVPQVRCGRSSTQIALHGRVPGVPLRLLAGAAVRVDQGAEPRSVGAHPREGRRQGSSSRSAARGSSPTATSRRASRSCGSSCTASASSSASSAAAAPSSGTPTRSATTGSCRSSCAAPASRASSRRSSRGTASRGRSTTRSSGRATTAARCSRHFPPADTYNAEATVPELRRSAARLQATTTTRARACSSSGTATAAAARRRAMLETLAPRPRPAGAAAHGHRRRRRSSSTRSRRSPAERPVVVGELYFEYHRGTYTSQARVKRGNRRCEQALHDAEFLAVARGGEYPRAELDRLWKLLLLQQFHDILPGSSIGLVYEDAARDLAELERGVAGARAASGGSTRREHDGVSRGATSSASSWSRRRRSAAARDRRRRRRGAGRRADARERAPARELSRGRPLVSLVEQGERPRDARRARQPPRALRRPIRSPSTRGTSTRTRSRRGRDAPPAASRAYGRDRTPLRAEIAFERRSASRAGCGRSCGSTRARGGSSSTPRSTGTSRTRCSRSASRSRCARRARPTRCRSATRSGRRTTRRAATRARTRCPATASPTSPSTASASALLTDSKYGYSCFGGELRLSLLRSPKSPDPEADMGAHDFAYALVPHAGGWRDAGVRRRGGALQRAAALGRRAARIGLSLRSTTRASCSTRSSAPRTPTRSCSGSTSRTAAAARRVFDWAFAVRRGHAREPARGRRRAARGRGRRDRRPVPAARGRDGESPVIVCVGSRNAGHDLRGAAASGRGRPCRRGRPRRRGGRPGGDRGGHDRPARRRRALRRRRRRRPRRRRRRAGCPGRMVESTILVGDGTRSIVTETPSASRSRPTCSQGPTGCTSTTSATRHSRRTASRPEPRSPSTAATRFRHSTSTRSISTHRRRSATTVAARRSPS